MNEITGTKANELVELLLTMSESTRLETKRVSGKMVGKALEAICAFANTQGGTLALGVEDYDKATGPARPGSKAWTKTPKRSTNSGGRR